MKKRILVELFYWFIAYLFILTSVSIDVPTGIKSIDSLAFLGMMLVIFYPHNWIINTYLVKRKWREYAISMVIFVTFTFIFMHFVMIPLWRAENELGWYETWLMIIFSTAFSFAFRGFTIFHRFEKVRKERIEAELKLLQSQLNPHFLFNTLNNIYALNTFDQNGANKMILHLADLMRYQTEISKLNEVGILSEITFLENYIALEKIRLKSNTSVSFATNITENPKLQVPPMLFIPFVENIFKHGIGSGKKQNNIEIELKIEKEQLIFKAQNTLPERQSETSSKVGLENLKKRLDLLFHQKHELLIEQTEQLYTVKLTIDYASKMFDFR